MGKAGRVMLIAFAGLLALLLLALAALGADTAFSKAGYVTTILYQPAAVIRSDGGGWQG